MFSARKFLQLCESFSFGEAKPFVPNLSYLHGEANHPFLPHLTSSMDQDFLSDFDMTDTPVFARKSKPPPPSPSTPSGAGIPAGNWNSNLDRSNMSTPSSSLLDTSNEIEKSPAASKTSLRRLETTFPSASAATGSESLPESIDPNKTDEPMDTGIPDPHILADSTNKSSIGANSSSSDNSNSKKARNRSKAKRSESKTPDVNQLLARLEDGQSGPLPPLPQQPQPQLPLPPLPPTPNDPDLDDSANSRSSNNDEGSGVSGGTKKKHPKKTTPRDSSNSSSSKSTDRNNRDSNKISGNLREKTSEGKNSSSGIGSQRTSERIPRISSHNRQWRADSGEAGSGPSTSGTDSSAPPSSSSSTSGNITRDKTNDSGSSFPTFTHSSSSSSSVSLLPTDAGNPRDGAPNSQTGSTTNSYQHRPRPSDSMCLDITSFRFSPDDDKRIAILLRRMRGDEKDHADLTSSDKVIIHKLPTVRSDEITGIPLDRAPGASSLYSVDDKFLSVADFASVEPRDPQIFHTITRRDSIVFIIVVRPELARGKLAWDLPAMSQCQDFVNDFLSKIYSADDNPSWTRTYVRAGKWGRVGTILLSSESIDDLSEFRRQFALWRFRNLAFDTYPKDVLTAKADVSILLRASMKTFNTEIIPKVLFSRNQDHIAGSLRVLATRFFSADEKSHKGDSKEHWRSVELKGCDQFMRCLRFIPENFAFLLGYDSVQIRGGLRPLNESLTSAGSKRSWADTPAPAVPLLQDPRNIFPSGNGPVPDNSTRGAAKRGRANRGSRRGQRGRAPRK